MGILYIYIFCFRWVEVIISCLGKVINLVKVIVFGKKIFKFGKKKIFILYVFLIFLGFSFDLFRNDKNYFIDKDYVVMVNKI